MPGKFPLESPIPWVSFLIGGLIWAAIAASLAVSTFAQTSVMLELQVDGEKRSAALRVPDGVESPPVVFYAHGATDSPEWFKQNGNTDATADREKYLAVYLCAHSDCQGGVWQNDQGPDNFSYILAVLDSVDARYKVDRSRIYMTGFSQGGNISSYAGCNHSDIFAAIAPISGHVNEEVPCSPERPVPVYITYGTQESFKGNFLKARDRWLELNNCPTTGTVTKPYPASNTSTRRVRHVYEPCDGNTMVVMDSIMGHGHRWPSQSNGNQADEVWNFFKQFTLPTTTAVRPRVSDISGAPITVSYGRGMIRLDGLLEEATVEVTDTRGKRTAAGKTRQQRFAFTGPFRGVYLVNVRSAGSVTTHKIILP